MQSHDCNLYSYELLGMNCETKLSNMVHLLDFTPHKPESMQSYTFVKSLARLNAYKKVGIVHRTKQLEGWKLKKWKVWERKRHEVEDMWSNVHRMEQNVFDKLHYLRMGLNELSQHFADEMIRQRVTMEINQILQRLTDRPHQHPRSLRQLNWVEQKRDKEKLVARVDRVKKASDQAKEDICRALIYVLDHPQGTSCLVSNTSAE